MLSTSSAGSPLGSRNTSGLSAAAASLESGALPVLCVLCWPSDVGCSSVPTLSPGFCQHWNKRCQTLWQGGAKCCQELGQSSDVLATAEQLGCTPPGCCLQLSAAAFRGSSVTEWEFV